MLQKYDPRNANIKVSVGGQLYDRKDAKISVFDSTVQGGDAVWEGLRRYPEGIVCLTKHLDRLQASAHTLAFTHIPTQEEIKREIRATLDANNMTNDTHIRLTLSRGEKITSGMDPRLNSLGSCLIVLAEWKPLVYDNESGIKVITSSIRRNGPQFLDSKIHHNNLLNNILAKIQANVAGVDAAVMLDDSGFVSELNDTNMFMVKGGIVYTPFADACLPGITRNTVMEIALKNGIPMIEKNLSLTEFYTADSAFATGTMGELTPIKVIDGREIKGDDSLMKKLQMLFRAEVTNLCEPI
jgi:branched-chain amino acid aminotransferase